MATKLMKKVADARDYEFDLCLAVWAGEYPALFRSHNPRNG